MPELHATSHTWLQRCPIETLPGVGAMAAVGSVLPASAVGPAGPAPVVGTVLAAEQARADAQRAAATHVSNIKGSSKDSNGHTKTLTSAGNDGTRSQVYVVSADVAGANSARGSAAASASTSTSDHGAMLVPSSPSSVVLSKLMLSQLQSQAALLETEPSPPPPPLHFQCDAPPLPVASGSQARDADAAAAAAPGLRAGAGAQSRAATHAVGLPFIVEYVAVDAAPKPNMDTTSVNSTTNLNASAGEAGAEAVNAAASAFLNGLFVATCLSINVPHNALLPATVPAPPGSALSAATTRGGARTYAPSPLEPFLMSTQPRIALGSVPMAGKPLRQPFAGCNNSNNSSSNSSSDSASANARAPTKNDGSNTKGSDVPSDADVFGPAVSFWPAAPMFGVFIGLDALSVPSVVHPLALLQRPRQPEMLLQALFDWTDNAAKREIQDSLYECNFVQRLYKCFQTHIIHIAILLLLIAFPILLIYRKHVGGSYSIYEMWPAVVFLIAITLSFALSIVAELDCCSERPDSDTTTEEVSLEHVAAAAESQVRFNVKPLSKLNIFAILFSHCSYACSYSSSV